MPYVTQIQTSRGTLDAWVDDLDTGGFMAYFDGVQYPDLAGVQAPAGGMPPAQSPDIALAELRRLVDARS